MSEPGPTWAVEAVKRVANGQRRHPQLWRLVANIQAEAVALAHLIEEPPPGEIAGLVAEEGDHATE